MVPGLGFAINHDQRGWHNDRDALFIYKTHISKVVKTILQIKTESRAIWRYFHISSYFLLD